MPYVYSGSDTNATSVTLPSDGDDKSAASVDVPFEAIWDRLTHLNAPEQGSGVPYPLATQSVTREQYITPLYNPSEWAMVTASPFLAVIGSSAVFLSQPLKVNRELELTDVGVYVAGDPGSHGALPATMPSIQVYEVDDSTGGLTPLGAGATDTSANVAAFEAVHLISYSFSASVDVVAKRYIVILSSEGGANAEADFTYYGCVIAGNMNQVDPI